MQWIARFNGAANRDDVPNALAIDSAGNVHITGSSQSTSGDRDFQTIKYSTGGNILWSVRWSGLAGDDIARAIAVDGSGNVFVTGSSAGAGSGLDYLTIKYDSNGELAFTYRLARSLCLTGAVAAGAQPVDGVFADFKDFVQVIHKDLPKTRIA